MMAPLRSATTMRPVDDTSLALPSDTKTRSGAQRVLDQVTTIKRTKSRTGKVDRNGSVTDSPTSLSPLAMTTYDFSGFRFSPSKTNGTLSRANSAQSSGFTKTIQQNAQKSRTLSARASKGRHISSSGLWEQQMSSANWPQGPGTLKPSRSDPQLAGPFLSVSAPPPGPQMRSKGQVSTANHQTIQTTTRVNRQSTNYSINNSTQHLTNSQTRMRPPSAQSQTDGRMGTIRISKTEHQSAVNSMVNMSDLSLKEAVEFLSHTDPNYQQCGATVIQHTTFKEENAKQQVFQLDGIPALVILLQSANPGVSQAAAAALRNLVFKDRNNKLEVQHCGGIGKALQLLKESDSTETQKQITGLLWNLSSTDELKEELIVTALPALTENVLVPFTSWSENSFNKNIHPDVFYNATGCLRNLSCAKKEQRQAMRKCSGLIDSLMSYMQSCVAEDNPDDKSVENCACILHNLTYKLEEESNSLSAFTRADNQEGGKKASAIGCFSPKTTKAQREFKFGRAKELPVDSNPTGVNWLWHPKAMQTYLSLLGSSQNNSTLEACCGAMQNLTAPQGEVSDMMSQVLAQKLSALLYMPPLLKSPNKNLQKTAMSLLGNMARTSTVQSSMAKQILPDLTKLVASGPLQMGKSDSTIATACSTVRSLMLAEPDFSKTHITDGLLTSLGDLSENGSYTKGSKAASLLLYEMWNEKSFQGVAKRLGRDKGFFINDNTTMAHKSAQVIESD